MKLVIQRVSEATVTVDGKVEGSIGKGFVVLWGAAQGDTKEVCEKMAAKCIKLRVFEDSAGKMNCSLKDIGGELLVISQFTLYADCRKGNRPNFLQAMEPGESEKLYEYFLEILKSEGINVEKGVFGADMKVQLINDGPVTICLNSKELTKS